MFCDKPLPFEFAISMYGNAGTHTLPQGIWLRSRDQLKESLSQMPTPGMERAQFRDHADHASKVSRKFSRGKTQDAKRNKPNETVVKDR